ncbi:ATP-binding protein [Pseudonocardia parietis]|uniref:Anti-sigma regulatory factor (Ser/Thr protein kinase) n=1 Tax=Pseudonocardia parietis TaxID=570936 RepID=A0ABS4W3V4_9PSEU|nr:ATP-binding protein [Pseudonocardia parietis]MBP2370628.1 anti-sigma regulatory factor (Ser/Thr protein kinase) [Pseudonocardia parietis]
MSSILHVELAAEPAAAGRSRRVTGRWLTSLCGAEQPCATAQDLVLAVNEAVSNSAEHAYRGDPSGVVVLHGTADGPRVELEVSDHGRWRDPPADNGFRGRGLDMIEAVAEDVRVERGPRGTTVTFCGTLGQCSGTCEP